MIWRIWKFFTIPNSGVQQAYPCGILWRNRSQDRELAQCSGARGRRKPALSQSPRVHTIQIPLKHFLSSNTKHSFKNCWEGLTQIHRKERGWWVNLVLFSNILNAQGRRQAHGLLVQRPTNLEMFGASSHHRTKTDTHRCSHWSSKPLGKT